MTDFDKKLYKYLLFLAKINFSNKILVVYPQREKFVNYKYIVRFGNHSNIVKLILKNRWWWSKADKKISYDKVNLY